MKLVHAADLHIDSPLRGLERYELAPVERMRGATRRAVENLVDLCLDEAADALLIAGDIFDGDWRDYATGMFLHGELMRLREGDVRVVLIRGNHDAASSITRKLSWPEHVTELATKAPQTVRFDDLGLAVTGQGFAKRVIDDDLAAAYPEPERGWLHVALLHTSVSGRPGHAPYAPCNLETLRSKGYDYWALGHVHAREILSEDPWVVFPGNLQGRHARETGAKGAMVIEATPEGVRSAEHWTCDDVRWARLAVDVADASSAAEALDLAREAIDGEARRADGRPLAIRVELTGASRAHAGLVDDRERWIHELRAAAHELDAGAWIEKVAIGTRPVVEVARLSERDDAVGEVARAFASLAAEGAPLDDLLAELEPLARRLPREARDRDDPDAIRLDAPETLRAALDEVQAEVLARLLAEGGGEA